MVIFHDIRMNILLVKFLLLTVTIFHSSARLRPRSPAAPIAPAAVAGAPASNETKQVNLLWQIDTY
jgi:hypothetical protein